MENAMRRWLLLFLLVLASAFVGYFLAHISTLYARVKLDRSYPALSRYEFERTPDVVLVGSSMTFRLYEGYFNTPLRNLSIGGGSSITGLSIIASYPIIPRVILVETNIMSRPIDRTLLEQFGKNDAEPYRWFRPFRAAISLAYYRIKFKSEAENVAQLPLLEPFDYDIATSVKEAREEYSNSTLDRSIERNTQILKQLVTNLESRGSKVFLYELPYPEGLGQSRYALTARHLTNIAFPDPQKWLELNYSKHQLRWLDASHMDERSAILVAREIDQIIRKM